MKKIALSILFAGVVASGSAQIAVYNFSARVQGINAGSELKTSESGKMFYDFATTNSITVIVDNSAKRVQTVLSRNQVSAVITGKGQDTFTALVTLPPGTPQAIFLGSPIIGKNAKLRVSSTQTVTFPKILNRHMESVSYNPPDDSGFSQSDEVYTFSQSSTQAANASSQSIDDAAQAMVDALVAKGYESF